MVGHINLIPIYFPLLMKIRFHSNGGSTLDNLNNNEQISIPQSDELGTWTVAVSSNALIMTGDQLYSLVITSSDFGAVSMDSFSAEAKAESASVHAHPEEQGSLLTASLLNTKTTTVKTVQATARVSTETRSLRGRPQ